jgi:cyanophycin synthetase
MLADLAMRLDVTGRRIVVLAGPGDRRDEDLVAIAKAVAGRFDHYICRRDDNLRNRAPDEVPRIQARALQEAGVPGEAISVIPDEQDAIDAALRLGESGDLLLIFADALVRSWKQITKFKPAGAPAIKSAAPPARPAIADGKGDLKIENAPPAAYSEFNLDGLIRDERGVRLAPEIED